jgi:transposase
MEPIIRQNIDVSNPHMGESWIYIGLDLGERIWVAGVLDLRTCTYFSRKFDSGDVWRNCLDWLSELKKKEGCQVHVLYEVGRQGFELARQLRQMGIQTDIVAVSRLEKGRRKKMGKSDQMDAKALSYLDWTKPKFPLLWIPTRKQESARNLLMWERVLRQSLRRCRNRSISILARWGVQYKKCMSAARYEELLEGIGDGVVGVVDRLRLDGLWREESFLRQELVSLEVIYEREMVADEAVAKLMRWRGLGERTSRVLSWYVGDWGRFPNGRSFSAYCGLTSVHVRSGSMDIDKGISHAGHPLLRGAFGQLALLWMRWQPDCELVKAASQRITNGKAGRLARTALARQLAVALWNWMVYDKPIPGALFSEEENSKE